MLISHFKGLALQKKQMYFHIHSINSFHDFAPSTPSPTPVLSFINFSVPPSRLLSFYSFFFFFLPSLLPFLLTFPPSLLPSSFLPSVLHPLLYCSEINHSRLHCPAFSAFWSLNTVLEQA